MGHFAPESEKVLKALARARLLWMQSQPQDVSYPHPSVSPTAHLVPIPELFVDTALIDDPIYRYEQEFFWSRAYLK